MSSAADRQNVAFDALHRCERDCSIRAWRLAVSLLGNREDAEDVVQEAFLVVARKPQALPQDHPWPWFGGVIANLARNAKRRRIQRMTQEFDETRMHAPCSDRHMDDERMEREEQEALRAALAGLDEDEREAVVLTQLGELSYKDAARALGIPLGTLNGRVRRGLANLRATLGAGGHRGERVTDEALGRRLAQLPVAVAGELAAMRATWLATAKSAAVSGMAASGTSVGITGVMIMGIKTKVAIAVVILAVAGFGTMLLVAGNDDRDGTGTGEESSHDTMLASGTGTGGTSHIRNSFRNSNVTRKGADPNPRKTGSSDDAASSVTEVSDSDDKQPSKESALRQPNANDASSSDTVAGPVSNDNASTKESPSDQASSKANDPYAPGPRHLASIGEGVPWDNGEHLRCFVVSPDGALIATGADTSLKIWDAHSGQVLKTMPTGREATYALAFSPDGTLLASGGANHPIYIWEVQSASLRHTLKESTYATAIAWSGNGKTLAALNYGGTKNGVLIWDASSFGLLASFGNGESRAWKGIGLSHDGQKLYRLLASRERRGDIIEPGSRLIVTDLRTKGDLLVIASEGDPAKDDTGWAFDHHFSCSGTPDMALVVVNTWRSLGQEGEGDAAGAKRMLDWDQEFRLYDLEHGNLVRVIPIDRCFPNMHTRNNRKGNRPEGHVASCAISRHAESLAMLGDYGDLAVLDRFGEAPVKSKGMPNFTSQATFGNTTNDLFFQSGSRLQRIDLASGATSNTSDAVAMAGAYDGSGAAGFTGDGRALIVQGMGAKDIALALEPTTLAIQREIPGVRCHDLGFIQSPQSSSLVLGLLVNNGGSSMGLFDARSGSVATTLEGSNRVLHCSVASDGTIVAGLVSSNMLSLVLWDAHSGSIIKEEVVAEHPGSGGDMLTINPDGSRVAIFLGRGSNASDPSPKLLIYMVATGEWRSVTLTDLGVTKSYLSQMSFSRDLKTLFVSTNNWGSELISLDTDTMQVVRRMKAVRREADLSSDDVRRNQTQAYFSHFAFTPDESKMLAGGWNPEHHRCFLIDVESGNVLSELQGHRSAITCCAVSPDGKVGVTTSQDKTIRLWNLEGPYDH